MNKTLTINIAGSVFHIDENAYQKLDSYLKAIKRSFPLNEQDEILHDIEIRIAELFAENITDVNQVITIQDVDHIITIMGKPEDYLLDDEASAKSETKNMYTPTKKLYRDRENAMVGGVLAGLGHYFKVDTVWMRIIFMILVLFYGTGVLLYLILWIIIPEAKTTTQLLEMQREPINISTIEKKVMENVSYVTDKINNVDYHNLKNQTKRAGERGGQVILNIIGILLISVSILMLFGAILTFCGAWINEEVILAEIGNDFPLFTANTYPFWVSIALLTTLTSLPFVGLLIIGLRMIYSNIKYVTITLIGLFVIWIIALGLFTAPFLNIKNYEGDSFLIEANETVDNTAFSYDEETTELTIKLVTPDYFKSDKSTTAGYEVTESNALLPIQIEILPTFQNEIYGTSKIENILIGKKNKYIHVDIDYNQYDKTANQLIISSELVPEIIKDKMPENAKITYTIYLPKGKKVYLNEPIKALLNSQYQLSTSAHWYEMQEDMTLKCTDC